MFADHWIIAQLIGQICSIFLFIIALFTSMRIMYNWEANSASELQINLERQTYLTSTIVRYVLIFQIVSMFVFIFTVNNHLPGLIRGAMCASGTLTVNSYGYPLLFIKIMAIPFYAIYLFMEYLDQSESEYPLTPSKFWLVIPSFCFLVTDFIFTLLYFGQIDPQVIATCCSISFTTTSDLNENILFGGQWIDKVLILFYMISVCLVAGLILIKKYPVINLILSFLFIPVSVYSLKYHFVKFIYELPSHNCLFDIFWSQYHYIGYILFGSLLIVIINIIFINIYPLIQSKLQKNHDQLMEQFRFTALFCTLLFVIINSAYWLYWLIFRL
jgi:hypothetical protein